MSVFSAVFGCRGDGGFNGPLWCGSSGVVGFNVAVFLSSVRDVFRPARPHVGASAKKFALRAHNGPKLAFDGPPGEFVAPCAWQPGRMLAVLTLQCAAKPYWWHGGQPAQAATYRVNVRIKGPRPPPGGPRPPPIGLTCELKGAARTQVRAAPHKQSAQCSPSCSFRRS